MKIGIYAGTFDPIHDGHIGFAAEAIQSGSLDRVIIVAEKEPYRKKPEASWDHRQAMVERATESVQQVDHDYDFANQLAHKHTMRDMMTVAKKHYGANNEYWFLVGSDIFEHIHQWADILSDNEYGGFIVALRDDHNIDWLNRKLTLLNNKIPKKSLIILDSSHPRISSSLIRQKIKGHQSVDNIPSDVLGYAQEHQLYS
ncbi:nicotinate-nicotinamide nucleotide adenylyltransferase [Candidatus Nomurabacteria bacterium]|nr:nicotinate-nicotinamide nucleotide adenylyltransferase [Candidatus Nomurabacteria bacterium]